MTTMDGAPSLNGSDLTAIVLSVLAPGVGHMMLGQTTKGILILSLVVLSCGVGYLVSAVIAIDAFLVARARKERFVGEWELFPEHRRVIGV